MTHVDTAVSDSNRAGVSPWLTFLLACACGTIVANLYYAQPLIGPIGASLGISAAAAGLIVTVTQIGYGLGLVLIVPLADLVENRALVLVTTSLVTLALIGAALSTRPLPFLLAAFLIGVTSVSVQIFIPYASHLAPEAVRGRVVGNVTTGLMLGVLLARPASSFIASFASWHAVYAFAAVLMVAIVLVLARALPRRVPAGGMHYGALLSSLVTIVRTTPLLRRRALYQAALFAAFSLFWSTAPLLLIGPFHRSQRDVALFALAGVAGACAAPIAGRIADRGWSRAGTGTAIVLVALAFTITLMVPAGSGAQLVALVAAAVVLDLGAQANLVFGFRSIFGLDPERRSRINGIYMATFFLAGAVGSVVGVWVYAHDGWATAASIGIMLPLAAFLFFLTEGRQ
jgi:predicted MFS family arabinose efflux permease